MCDRWEQDWIIFYECQLTGIHMQFLIEAGNYLSGRNVKYSKNCFNGALYCTEANPAIYKYIVK